MIIDKIIPSLTLCRGLVVSYLCLFMFASIYCSRGSDRTPSKASTITLLYPGDETYLGHCVNMDPRLLIFDPLIGSGQNGELEGLLAETWEHSPDYRTWTIQLHKDARWHDGAPVTAHDIKFTLELMSHSDVRWLPLQAYSIDILDEKKFKITYDTEKSSSYHALDEWEVYYPRHLLKDLDPKELCHWEFWKMPVGNGPYCYVSHIPKEMVELRANPDYHKGKPKIERVILKFGIQVVTELLSGNVDGAVWASPNDALKLRKDPRFIEYYEYGGWHAVIYWNQKYKKFNDPRVRRALTLAINRKELHRFLNLPEELPIVDGAFTFRQQLRGELPESIPFDPEEAQSLLDEAGWRDVDGDGVREYEGEDFRFTAIVRSEGQNAAIYIQDQLQRVGVRMDVSPLSFELIHERWRSGDFEAVFHLFAAGIIRRILNFFNENSLIGYYNPRIEKLLEVSLSNIAPNKLDDVYRELWPIFQEDMPLTFLFPAIEINIVHRRVRGLASPRRANPIFYMKDLWIEEEK